MRNPFKNKMMRDAYDGSNKAYEARHRDLFLPNGERRKQGSYGSSFAANFWHGYDGVNTGSCNWDQNGGKDTIAYAVWCAGRDVKKREEQAGGMSAQDFSAWVGHMKDTRQWSAKECAKQLGCSANSITTWSKEGAPNYIGLACAAIAFGLPAWRRPGSENVIEADHSVQV